MCLSAGLVSTSSPSAVHSATPSMAALNIARYCSSLARSAASASLRLVMSRASASAMESNARLRRPSSSGPLSPLRAARLPVAICSAALTSRAVRRVSRKWKTSHIVSASAVTHPAQYSACRVTCARASAL